MVNEELINKMSSVEAVDINKLFIESLNVSGLKLLVIRDYIIEKGEVLEEDIEHNIYVAYFRTGLFKLNRTLVGFCLTKNNLTIATYSSKKSINKKLVNKIIDELINGNKKTKNLSKYIKFGLIMVLVISSFILSIFIPTTINATKEYNSVVLEFNDLAKLYNEKASLVSIDNIEGVPKQVDYLKEENDNIFSVFANVVKGNTSPKINKDIKTINNMKETLIVSSAILDKITNPTEDEVVKKLKYIDEIENIAYVTKDNDPNGFLGKTHGYTSCVYFSIKGIDLDNQSKDPIVLGNDGGGCIEVYSNLEDAKARCEYLKQFDGTILYTGSYALVGTMVIRTSYVLSNEQQYTLTDKIIKQFTKV